jgi:hypothetical protein
MKHKYVMTQYAAGLEKFQDGEPSANAGSDQASSHCCDRWLRGHGCEDTHYIGYRAALAGLSTAA